MLKTVSSVANAIGALNYKGTWNASTNSPALASGVGTKGDYYVVSVAGTTALDGISNWGIGDWAVFNGTAWQRVEGGADLNGVNLSVSGTTTLSGLTASTALALDASKNVVSVTNTGTGNNVLATSPALTTPNIGVATATSLNNTMQKVATATLPAGATSTLTVSGYGGGRMAQFQITADVGGSGAGSLIVSLAGLLSNSNYYQLVEIGKFSYLSITMNSATKQNGQFTVSIVNALGSAGTVTVLGIGNTDFSIAVA